MIGRFWDYGLVVLALLAVLIVASCHPAYAQQEVCGPRADILAKLGKQFREQPDWIGLSRRGYILQLLTSDNGRTFSIVAIYPNGTACVVDAGDGSERVNRLDYPTFGDGV